MLYQSLGFIGCNVETHTDNLRTLKTLVLVRLKSIGMADLC